MIPTSLYTKIWDYSDQDTVGRVLRDRDASRLYIIVPPAPGDSQFDFISNTPIFGIPYTNTIHTMSTLFKNKFRIPSARLKSWDYACNAVYFVTICTKNKEHYFGKISGNGDDIAHVVETPCLASPPQRPQFHATQIGKIARDEWYKTTELRPDMNLELGKFVVMPNHIHGIIIIGNNAYNSRNRRDAMHGVSTIPEPQNRFAPQSKNLASVVRGYKSAVTVYARKNGIAFDWQAGYHEHIIRSQDEYIRISRYIRDNPVKWVADRFNK